MESARAHSYDSEKAVNLGREVMSFIQTEADKMSEEIADISNMS